MKKLIRSENLSVTLSQLESGDNKGSCKITYRDTAGMIRIGGVMKAYAKATKRAHEILERLRYEDVTDLTAEEIRLIRNLRAAHVAPSLLYCRVT